MIILKHFRAILLLPAMVLIVIPAGLLFLSRSTGTLSIAYLATHPFSLVLGLVFAFMGSGLVISTVRLFIRHGEGTLAPWDPTQKLVNSGPYLFVRNPMISGVGLMLLGEALIFRIPALGLWTLIFCIANVIYIPLFEESRLKQQFGQAYLDYQQNVPRWLPWLTPWIPPVTDRETSS
ncbi:hypothetical protein N836_02520 [Leptolyngbya sp. Heron Island J]|uniref:methyltransferase family protein n=1 Tax=Leptolyngbya sp. Heron Island J TaxID=1385935 RepID=UPI0003B98A2F|nr:isoprenylcysteine carboxylmethyltransferase family protein [Leptolyngbya sp. Heron Island J]ESA38395.1 hypothetical protein N836_02520 [Leptolyngbya sp. Heron Island J]